MQLIVMMMVMVLIGFWLGRLGWLGWSGLLKLEFWGACLDERLGFGKEISTMHSTMQFIVIIVTAVISFSLAGG